eukprot:GEMP01009643.1.p1 GENE.GEMP01009643.1~~GEMP01009643.1.p1  ORF type:complete len:737 (+),score=173.90 GEMP01009643.1:189-2399(+)
MERQTQLMLRTMQAKLNKTRERERFHQIEMQKALEQSKQSKNQAMGYYDRLKHLTQKYEQVLAENGELGRVLERKNESEESMMTRVSDAERIAVDASDQALEIAETVQRMYEPERLRLKEADEEIARLKKSLRRSQQDLKISKMPAENRPSMVFSRSGSFKSFDEINRHSLTPTAFRRSSMGANDAHRSSSSSCPADERSSTLELSYKQEYEVKLRRSRAQEQSVRKSHDEALEQVRFLEDKARLFMSEKKTMLDRMGSLRERNRQLQAMLERQQTEFDGEVNELKQHLRQRKIENSAIFQIWKQSLDDVSPKNSTSKHGISLDDSVLADTSPEAPLIAPTPYEKDSPEQNPTVSANAAPPPPLGSLSGSAVPKRGSLRDLGPKHFPNFDDIAGVSQQQNQQRKHGSPTKKSIRQLVEQQLERDKVGMEALEHASHLLAQASWMEEHPNAALRHDVSGSAPALVGGVNGASRVDAADGEGNVDGGHSSNSPPVKESHTAYMPQTWFVDLNSPDVDGAEGEQEREDEVHEEQEEFVELCRAFPPNSGLHKEDDIAGACDSGGIMCQDFEVEVGERPEFTLQEFDWREEDTGGEYVLEGEAWHNPTFTQFGPLSPVLESPDRLDNSSNLLSRSWIDDSPALPPIPMSPGLFINGVDIIASPTNARGSGGASAAAAGLDTEAATSPTIRNIAAPEEGTAMPPGQQKNGLSELQHALKRTALNEQQRAATVFSRMNNLSS